MAALEESIFAGEIWPRIISKSDLKVANFETTYPGHSGFSRLPPRKLRNHTTPFPELGIRRYALYVCRCLPTFDAGGSTRFYIRPKDLWSYIYTYIHILYIYINTYLQEMMSSKSIQPIHMSQGIYPCSTLWVPHFTIRVANSTPTVAVGASRFDRLTPKFIGCRSCTVLFFLCHDFLACGFSPFEKYARQIGSFPQIGVKIKHIGNHHPELGFLFNFVLIPTTDRNNVGLRLPFNQTLLEVFFP